MFKKLRHDYALDREIDVALAELETVRSNPEKHSAITDRIVRLQKLQTRKGLQPPTMDTVLIVGANIFGVLYLAQFEQEHVIKAREAFRFMIRPKH